METKVCRGSLKREHRYFVKIPSLIKLLVLLIPITTTSCNVSSLKPSTELSLPDFHLRELCFRFADLRKHLLCTFMHAFSHGTFKLLYLLKLTGITMCNLHVSYYKYNKIYKLLHQILHVR